MYRRTMLLFFLPLLLVMTVCASHGWVHERPQRGGRSGTTVAPSELRGTYVRKVESRHSIANRTARAFMREWIEVGGSGPLTYEKVHLYADNAAHEQGVTGLRRATNLSKKSPRLFRSSWRTFREAGRLEIHGRWVLLIPERTFRGSGVRLLQENALGSPPPSDPARLKSAPNARPLLYHYDARTQSVTPATFERFGEFFEHGIYEGASGPFDNRSSTFQVAWRNFNEKTHQTHGYFRARTAVPTENRKGAPLL